MVNTQQTSLVTADELFDMPDDGQRYDLIQGELIRMPPAGFDHGRTQTNVARPVSNHVYDNDLGVVVGAETGFVLFEGPDTVLGPDLAFVRKELAPVREPRFARVVPDLVVEIVSPSERPRDVNRKVHLYLDAGVRLVWVVDPRHATVAVYAPDRIPRVLAHGDTLDGGDVLPGFRLPLAEIFA